MATTPIIAPRPEVVIGELVRKATLHTPDGRPITAGMATVTGTSERWTARIAQMDRPGTLASMFFSNGLREVRLKLDDGRTALARITGTTFVALSERVCDLESIDPLA